MDDGPESIGIEDSSEFAYAEAHRLLDEARERAFEQYRREAAKRRRIVIAVLVAWVLLAVILYVAVSPDMLVAGELGFAAWVAFAVFYLMPSIMGKSNLQDAFDQYEAQVNRLEAALVPFPVCMTVEQLADALALIPDPGDSTL